MQKRNQALEKLYFNIDNLDKDFRNKNLNLLVLSKLAGEKFLDVGCGVGHLLVMAERKGMNVLGLEPNQNLIKMGEKIYKRKLPIKKNTAEELVVSGEKFDSIVLIDVIEHIQDDNKILRKICALLEKKGRMILVTSAFPFLYGKRDIAVGHFRRYSKRQIHDKLTEAGFEIEEMRYWDFLGFFPYFIFEKIFKKSLLVGIRGNRKNLFSNVLVRILDKWFNVIENNISFGFGLSHVVVAARKK